MMGDNCPTREMEITFEDDERSSFLIALRGKPVYDKLKPFTKLLVDGNVGRTEFTPAARPLIDELIRTYAGEVF